MKKNILLILIVLLLVSGCAKKEEKKVVNVLNWSSYIPDEVIKDFEKDSGIKVNYGTYSSNEELLAKLSSSKEGTYDVVFPSDYMVDVMIKRNLIEKIDKNRLQNIGNIDRNYMNMEYPADNYSYNFF